jgi:hypothetical protein
LILPFFLHILSTLRVLFVDFIGVWDSLMVLNIIYHHQVGSCFKKWAKSGVPLQTSSSWFVRHRSTRHVTHFYRPPCSTNSHHPWSLVCRHILLSMPGSRVRVITLRSVLYFAFFFYSE